MLPIVVNLMLISMLAGVRVSAVRAGAVTAAGILLAVQSGCGDPVHGPGALAPEPPPSAVSPADAAPLPLSMRDSVLQVGERMEARITDSAFAASLRLRFLGSPATWSSSDSSVLQVSAEGEIVGVAEGSADVSAYWQGRTGVRSLRVIASMGEDPPGEPPAPEPPAPEPPSPIPPVPGPESFDESPAELPRVQVELPVAEGSGTVRRVRNGQSLQAAIDAAQRGDVILLEEGARFSEAVVLRNKPGVGMITIRTDATPTPAGVRVSLADTLRFARLVGPGPGQSPLRTEPGASGYWLINLDITPSANTTSINTLIHLGDGGSAQNTLQSIPREIYLDRLIVRGFPNVTLRRCISLHSALTAIVNSLILECHEKGADSQGIGGWNGPGPYRIENNRIEGAGQNIMFGGADPAISGMHPSDIVIRGNHFIKPPLWHASRQWTIKNHLQFKMAQRALVTHNLFENVWVDGQTGMSIAASSTNQSGNAPWAETRDITIVSNVFRNAARGITLAANGGSLPVQLPSRFFIARNIMYRLGANSAFGGAGEPIRLIGGVPRVTIVENTMDATGTAVSIPSDGEPARRDSLVLRRNVVAFGSYGVFGSGIGLASIQARYNSYRFDFNCFYRLLVPARAPASAYPAPNLVSDEETAITLPGISNGDPTIGAGSVCRTISVPQGRSLGADPGLTPLLESRVISGVGLP